MIRVTLFYSSSASRRVSCFLYSLVGSQNQISATGLVRSSQHTSINSVQLLVVLADIYSRNTKYIDCTHTTTDDVPDIPETYGYIYAYRRRETQQEITSRTTEHLIFHINVTVQRY